MTRDGRPVTELARLISGFQASQAVHVAATLGIADLLADGARASDDLAAETGSHPESLYRLMRALAGLGVLTELDDRAFELTPMGEHLRSDSAEPLGGWAANLGQPYYFEAWANLEHSVRTGESAFVHCHGQDAWEYRVDRPEKAERFDRAMTDLSRLTNRALLESYDFSRFETVVDVGGGHGALLAAILGANPATRGVLFDQPSVVAGAGPLLEAAGVADRCETVGGSFFDSVPEGGDAYALKWILHDWDDEEATAILRACRRAVPDDGAVLVIERDLGGPNEAADVKLSDLNMLVVLGGRERTVDEYGELLAGAGFRLTGQTPTPAGLSVIEAVPAS
jgi:O-methyltransferase domain/Dimerisation domain